MMLCTLAHTFEQGVTKLDYDNALISRKLDGIRCLAHRLDDGRVELYSRDQKFIQSSPHIVQSLENISLSMFPKGAVLDGELYIHGLSPQVVSGICRRKTPDDKTALIRYYVFDIAQHPQFVAADQTFRNRFEWLTRMALHFDEHIKLVEHCRVRSEGEVVEFEQRARQEGFEGAIIRSPIVRGGRILDDGYQTPELGFPERTMGILKVKIFQDEEFEMIGVKQEIDLKGNPKPQAGAIICRDNKLGVEFQAGGIVRAMKQDMWENRENYIGKRVTIKFFGKSDRGIPRHPTFVKFREGNE